MLKNILTSILFLTVVVFVISIYFLLFQIIGVDGANKATILSGILSMIGGAVGAFGAYIVAMNQNKVQKDRDDQKAIENKRSYVILMEMWAELKLTNLKTHEDSRIIDTTGYQEILDKVGKAYKGISTTYLKLSQYGNSPVIINCKIEVEYRDQNNKSNNLVANIGVLEQGIEVFIPIVPPGANLNEAIIIDVIKVVYLTLAGEKMKWEIRHLEDIQYHSYFNKEGKEIKLFSTPINTASWTYLNK